MSESEAWGDGPESTTGTSELNWPTAGGPWIVEVGSAEGSETRLLRQGERLIIGAGASADLRVPDRAVSGRHCALEVGAYGVSVVDLDSTNGTFVGGGRVSRSTFRGASASFVIGCTTVVVRQRGGEPPEAVEALPGLVGASDGMRRVARLVRRHAALRAPVLIQGESGTGKDVVARALHTLSGRKGSYVPLNVGAIPESLAETELFGHRRGAFTGAVASREGAFEQANGGTLFLDEVAELSLGMQVRLLRVVEDGVVRPVGGGLTEVDVRIVSASWAPLEERVSQGRFRLDLFHRLSMAVIELPPLRERRSDIPGLARALLERHATEVGERELSPSAMVQLQTYSWPGNVRELGAVLYRASVLSQGRVIEGRDVDAAMPSGSGSRARSLDRADAERLLEHYEGNVSAAARAARVPRSTFRAWLTKRS